MTFPAIQNAGFDGVVVCFGDALTDPANTAALAFRGALERDPLDGVLETSTSLVSAYIKFDPFVIGHDAMRAQLTDMLHSRDWYAAALPEGRGLWRIPVAFGGTLGPQLAKAADLAGLSEAEAIASITGARVRVQTIGFAPGMPYLGALSPAWDIPRQKSLTAAVPAGGLCVAIRQLVLFPNTTPTGWRHIGQTQIRLFEPQSDQPFKLSAGDEVAFVSVTAAELAELSTDPTGGAVREDLP